MTMIPGPRRTLERALLQPAALAAYRRGCGRARHVEVTRVHFSDRRPVVIQYLVDGNPVFGELIGDEAVCHALHERRRLIKRGQLAPGAREGIGADPMSGLVFRLPGLDARLPGLRLLRDLDDAAEYAALALGQARNGRSARTRLRAHRLYKRAVLEIELDDGARVFARLRSPKSGGGLASWGRHREIADQLARCRAIRVPAPLHYDPALGAAFYGPLDGEPLELGARPSPLERTIDMMDAFRSIDARNWTPHDARDEIALTGRWVRRVLPHRPKSAPVLVEAFEQAADALDALAPREPRACHRDLHEGQILVGNGAAGLLDFDTVRRADPALDAGNLIAHLRLAGLRQRISSTAFEARIAAATGDRAAVCAWTRIALVRLACIHAFTPEGRRITPLLLDLEAAA